MHEKLRVAVIGCGAFAKFFVPLFQAHPLVEYTAVCDLIPERAAKYAADFSVPVIPTFEEALERRDINAIAVFTQRHTHGPLVIAALKAGKDVYSAVPMASSVDDCAAILETVRSTGRTYMMGETCIYYPCSMFCKREYEKGTFGHFVFGESQYFHDLSHFSEDFRADRPHSAIPPMLYPTHSTSMLLHALSDRAVKVSACGYRDQEEDTPFRRDVNPWGNEFSGEFSLMQLAGGGVARVSEVRRIGYKSPSSYISGFYGTKASYQFSNAQHVLTRLTAKGVDLTDVSDEINPEAMTKAKYAGDPEFMQKAANHVWQGDSPSPMQAERRASLPASYAAARNGHMASHQLLIDDFCTAVYAGTKPSVDALLAARYTVPGLIAHESAMRGGVLLDVPDLG